MRQVVMLFPNELWALVCEARFNEKRSSTSEFVREALKIYLKNNGYKVPDNMEVLKPGYRASSNKPAEAVAEVIAPIRNEPPVGWEQPQWPQAQTVDELDE